MGGINKLAWLPSPLTVVVTDWWDTRPTHPVFVGDDIGKLSVIHLFPPVRFRTCTSAATLCCLDGRQFVPLIHLRPVHSPRLRSLRQCTSNETSTVLGSGSESRGYLSGSG